VVFAFYLLFFGAARVYSFPPFLFQINPYITSVRVRFDYGDKRACNKQAGPGCDSPRLHHKTSTCRPRHFVAHSVKWGKERMPKSCSTFWKQCATGIMGPI